MLQLLMKLLPLLLLVQVHAGQIPLNQRLRDRPSTWRSWGPFPIGTRELPLLPPLKTKATMLSPLVPGGAVSESEVKEDADGWVATGDERISWDSLRKTAGWSALQYQHLYERTLVVESEGTYSFVLDGAAEFALTRIKESSDASDSTTQWYNGNIYGYDGQPHFAELEQGTYRLTVTYAHDIRVSGEPGADGVPRSRWRLRLRGVNAPGFAVNESKSLAPSVVGGWIMGDVAGVEVTNSNFNETVTIYSVEGSYEGVSVWLQSPVVVAPLQTRSLPLTLLQSGRLPAPRHASHKIALTLHLTDKIVDSRKGATLSTVLVLPVVHSSPSKPTPFLSTFLSNTRTPSYAMYTPPTHSNSSFCSSAALLALHGAGVEASSSSWTESIPARSREWAVWPTGLTSWGYDWHGPSLKDVEAAVTHLDQVEERWSRVLGNKGAPAECSVEKKLVVLGHSNGSQGAAYFSSHYPDRVLGTVPVSGYLKIEDYVPYHLSVGHHYRDPALTGILSASLTQFDNDLYASNLVEVPTAILHGGADDNVPVQHGRQLQSVIGQWSRGNSSVSYYEFLDGPHWWSDCFSSDVVTGFIDNLLNSSTSLPGRLDKFTLTTANPDESGSKLGFRIIELETPGRLARIEVEVLDRGTLARVSTTNVRSFSLARETFSTLRSIAVNGHSPIAINESADVSTFSVEDGTFSLSPPRESRRYGSLISILTSAHPLRLVVGSQGPPATTRRLTSIAQRIAHDSKLYGGVDVEILFDETAETSDGQEGNVVLLGGAYENSLTARWASSWATPISFLSPSAFAIHDRIFETPGQGLLSLIPHPSHASSLALVLTGIGAEGLERAARMFPVRTGVPLPDWVVSSPSPTSGGIEAAGFWSNDWKFSDRASFL